MIKKNCQFNHSLKTLLFDPHSPYYRHLALVKGCFFCFFYPCVRIWIWQLQLSIAHNSSSFQRKHHAYQRHLCSDRYPQYFTNQTFANRIPCCAKENNVFLRSKILSITKSVRTAKREWRRKDRRLESAVGGVKGYLVFTSEEFRGRGIARPQRLTSLESGIERTSPFTLLLLLVKL